MSSSMKDQSKTRVIVQMGILAAMSILLVYLIRIPMFLPFLEYDPADIPILIGTFMFGPLGGVVLAALVSILQGITVSASSGIIGIVMHFFASGSCAFVAGMIYKRKHTIKGALIALIAGIVVWVGMMVIWNYIFTPIFMGTSREEVAALLLPAIIPFNLVKSVINSVVTFLLYKSISKVLKLDVHVGQKKTKALTPSEPIQAEAPLGENTAVEAAVIQEPQPDGVPVK